MPDLKCPKCKMEYHILDEYIKVYKEEGKRCGCGEMMEVVGKKINKRKVKK
jgi:hypothetical protein